MYEKSAIVIIGNIDEWYDPISKLIKVASYRRIPVFEVSHIREIFSKLKKKDIGEILFCGNVTTQDIKCAIEKKYNVLIIDNCCCPINNDKHDNSKNIINDMMILGVRSKILYNIDLDIDFESIKNEINWHQMIHKGNPVPRLVSLQGNIQNNNVPIYRHPADEQPILTQYTKSVQMIVDYLEKLLDQRFNHVLIQYYRSGNDFIGEHSDKTLDIEIGSTIVNFSIGATRYMQLIPKEKNNKTQQIALRHKSVFCLDWDTNKKYLHAIKQDKRDLREKSEDELLFNGERISFTFRTIATFINNGKLIGQGAPKNDNTKTDDFEDLILAFSHENSDDDFDWNKYYGNGFHHVDNRKIN